MTKDKKLYRPLFLLSVLLLLSNDLFLKYEFHNFLTGKLSDFAGLFAFPYFLSYIIKKKINLIYILTGVIFIIWKTEYIQPIINFINFNGIGLNRTVDYSDLIALSILPYSFYYWHLNSELIVKPTKFFKPLIIGICSFSFLATSLQRKSEKYNFKSNHEFIIETPFVNAQNELHYYQQKDSNNIRYSIQLPEKYADINTKYNIFKTPEGFTKIELDSILDFSLENKGSLFWNKYDKKDLKYLRNLTKKEIEQIFEQQIRKKFKEK